MKIRTISLITILLLISGNFLFSQNTVTVTATDYDISDNLNLEAVATLFSESKNIQQFEQRLNEPRYKISNLDLNNDGYVDYIRVVEHYRDNEYLITLQDIIGDDLYQDIATIDVRRNTMGQINFQIIGNPYFYGANYIIEPVFNRRPVIYSYFWNPYFRIWNSPYGWKRFPRFYHPWRVYSEYRYLRNIRRFIHPSYFYRYLHYHRNELASFYNNRFRRNDYERHYPHQSFANKYNGISNHYELQRKRNSPNNNIPSNRNENIGRKRYNDGNKHWRTGNSSITTSNRGVRYNNTQPNVNRRSQTQVRYLPSKRFKPSRSAHNRTNSTRYAATKRAPRPLRNNNGYTHSRINRSVVKKSNPVSHNRTRVVRTKHTKDSRSENHRR